MDERCDQVSGDLEGRVVALGCVALLAAHIRVGQDLPGAQDLADPPLVARDDRQALREVIGKASPRSDLEDVIAEDADGGRVGAQRQPRLVDDHAEEVGPIVRRGEPPGDAEDRVEPLGELGLQRPAGRGRAGHRDLRG
jgi:hypothetical protein